MPVGSWEYWKTKLDLKKNGAGHTDDDDDTLGPLNMNLLLKISPANPSRFNLSKVLRPAMPHGWVGWAQRNTHDFHGKHVPLKATFVADQ
jgi:hypothetical protein